MLDPKLLNKLDLLGFKETSKEEDYVDFTFTLEGKKLIKLCFAKGVGIDEISYWFENLVELDYEDWEYLDPDFAEDLIENIILYKNWLRFFKKQLAEITKEYGMWEA